MDASNSVTVELDRERRIRYPMAAVSDIEDKFDADLMAGDGVDPEGVDDVVWLIWLGLKYGEPDRDPMPVWRRVWCRLLELLGVREPEPELSEDFVAQHVDLANMDAVLGAVNRAMGGKEIEGEVAPPQAGKRQEIKTA